MEGIMDIEKQKLLMVSVENNSKMVFDNFIILNRRFDQVDAALHTIESFLRRLELGMSVLESELLAFGRKDLLPHTEQDPTNKSTNTKGTSGNK